MSDKTTQKRYLRAREADGEFIAYIAEHELCSLEMAIKYFITHSEYQNIIDGWVGSSEKRDILELLIEQYQLSN